MDLLDLESPLVHPPTGDRDRRHTFLKIMTNNKIKAWYFRKIFLTSVCVNREYNLQLHNKNSYTIRTAQFNVCKHQVILNNLSI